jgi:hypothetical protein
MSNDSRIDIEESHGDWERQERVLAAFEDSWQRGEDRRLTHMFPSWDRTERRCSSNWSTSTSNAG